MTPALTNEQFFGILMLVLACGWLVTTTAPGWLERRRARRAERKP